MNSETPVKLSSPEGAPEVDEDVFATPAPAVPPAAPKTFVEERPRSTSQAFELAAWTNVKLSAIVYCSVTAFAYCFLGMSPVSFLCYAMITQILVMRTGMFLAEKGVKRAEVLTTIPLPSEAALRAMANSIVTRTRTGVEGYTRLVKTDNYAQLAGTLLGLYALKMLGDILSLPTMAFIVFQLFFIITPIYTKNQDTCDRLGEQAAKGISEKVVAPSTKKFAELSEQVQVLATPYKQKVMEMMGRSPATKSE